MPEVAAVHPSSDRPVTNQQYFASAAASFFSSYDDNDQKKMFSTTTGADPRHIVVPSGVNRAPVTAYRSLYGDCAGVDLDDPAVRRRTFMCWPANAGRVVESDMADAGFFFTGSGAEVRCFRCALRVPTWRPGDDPMDVHRSRNPSCPFVISAASVAVGGARSKTTATTTSRHRQQSSSLDEYDDDDDDDVDSDIPNDIATTTGRGSRIASPQRRTSSVAATIGASNDRSSDTDASDTTDDDDDDDIEMDGQGSSTAATRQRRRMSSAAGLDPPTRKVRPADAVRRSDDENAGPRRNYLNTRSALTSSTSSSSAAMATGSTEATVVKSVPQQNIGKPISSMSSLITR